MAAYFLLIGLLAPSVTKFVADNPRWAETAARSGFGGLATVEGYVASFLGLLAIPVEIFAATRIGAAASDEAEGRLTMLLAQPVSRTRWARVEAAVTVLACAALGTVAGLSTWLGTVVAHAPLGLGPALAGALNALPVAMLFCWSWRTASAGPRGYGNCHRSPTWLACRRPRRIGRARSASSSWPRCSPCSAPRGTPGAIYWDDA